MNTDSPRIWKRPDGRTLSHVNRHETAALYKEIFVDRAYAPEGMTIPEGAVIADVGANVGLFSVFAAEEWNPTLIVAVEPLPMLQAALHANLSTFRSIVVMEALSDVVGESQITMYPKNTIMSARNAVFAEDFALLERQIQEGLLPGAHRDELHELVMFRLENYPVSCRTNRLDLLMLELSIETLDLLKIDVEGDELAVLQGSPKGLKGINNVIVEVGDPSTARRTEDLLTEAGMRVRQHQTTQFQNSDMHLLWGSRLP